LPSPLLADWMESPRPAVQARRRSRSGRATSPGGRATHGSPAASALSARASVLAHAGPSLASDKGGAHATATDPARSSVWLPARMHRESMLETLEDRVGLSWPTERPLPSGTRSLELQNQCPFRAYAELRLGSGELGVPEPGVAPDLRGQLLHA